MNSDPKEIWIALIGHEWDTFDKDGWKYQICRTCRRVNAVSERARGQRPKHRDGCVYKQLIDEAAEKVPM